MKTCTRCGKKLTGQTYGVSGHNGTFGLQCALQVCQGKRYLLRPGKTVTQVYDGPLPGWD